MGCSVIGWQRTLSVEEMKKSSHSTRESAVHNCTTVQLLGHLLAPMGLLVGETGQSCLKEHS